MAKNQRNEYSLIRKILLIQKRRKQREQVMRSHKSRIRNLEKLREKLKTKLQNTPFLSDITSSKAVDIQTELVLRSLKMEKKIRKMTKKKKRLQILRRQRISRLKRRNARILRNQKRLIRILEGKLEEEEHKYYLKQKSDHIIMKRLRAQLKRIRRQRHKLLRERERKRKLVLKKRKEKLAKLKRQRSKAKNKSGFKKLRKRPLIEDKSIQVQPKKVKRKRKKPIKTTKKYFIRSKPKKYEDSERLLKVDIFASPSVKKDEIVNIKDLENSLGVPLHLSKNQSSTFKSRHAKRRAEELARRSKPKSKQKSIEKYKKFSKAMDKELQKEIQRETSRPSVRKSAHKRKSSKEKKSVEDNYQGFSSLQKLAEEKQQMRRDQQQLEMEKKAKIDLEKLEASKPKLVDQPPQTAEAQRKPSFINVMAEDKPANDKSEAPIVEKVPSPPPEKVPSPPPVRFLKGPYQKKKVKGKGKKKRNYKFESKMWIEGDSVAKRDFQVDIFGKIIDPNAKRLSFKKYLRNKSKKEKKEKYINALESLKPIKTKKEKTPTDYSKLKDELSDLEISTSKKEKKKKRPQKLHHKKKRDSLGLVEKKIKKLKIQNEPTESKEDGTQTEKRKRKETAVIKEKIEETTQAIEEIAKESTEKKERKRLIGDPTHSVELKPKESAVIKEKIGDTTQAIGETAKESTEKKERKGIIGDATHAIELKAKESTVKIESKAKIGDATQAIELKAKESAIKKETKPKIEGGVTDQPIEEKVEKSAVIKAIEEKKEKTVDDKISSPPILPKPKSWKEITPVEYIPKKVSKVMKKKTKLTEDVQPILSLTKVTKLPSQVKVRTVTTCTIDSDEDIIDEIEQTYQSKYDIARETATKSLQTSPTIDIYQSSEYQKQQGKKPSKKHAMKESIMLDEEWKTKLRQTIATQKTATVLKIQQEVQEAAEALRILTEMDKTRSTLDEKLEKFKEYEEKEEMERERRRTLTELEKIRSKARKYSLLSTTSDFNRYSSARSSTRSTPRRSSTRSSARISSTRSSVRKSSTKSSVRKSSRKSSRRQHRGTKVSLYSIDEIIPLYEVMEEEEETHDDDLTSILDSDKIRIVGLATKYRKQVVELSKLKKLKSIDSFICPKERAIINGNTPIAIVKSSILNLAKSAKNTSYIKLGGVSEKESNTSKTINKSSKTTVALSDNSLFRIGDFKWSDSGKSIGKVSSKLSLSSSERYSFYNNSIPSAPPPSTDSKSWSLKLPKSLRCGIACCNESTKQAMEACKLFVDGNKLIIECDQSGDGCYF